ncbi:MAG: PD-(D/E)XK nuclease family protein [Caldimonas sp.]
MKTIARVTPGGPGGARVSRTDGLGQERWDCIAVDCADWARQASVAWRDVVVLVPFVELLAPARRAFARLGTWMPRIETTRTLAASLGPPTGADDESGFDAALDTLVATQLLGRQRWGAEWMHRDRRGFEHAAGRVATTARELARAASARMPSSRPAWWQAARDALEGGVGGPAGLEKQLARIAVEWAANAPDVSSTDRLFDLRPLAWIAIQAGGADRLALALIAQGDAPALVVETDVPLDQPFAALAHELGDEAPAHALCDGFEDEAWAAAAQVLDHLGRDERPVALVALDRVLVRRVRALLERAGARIADETGWKMSTTRAGASVMSLLHAARPGAGADEYLDWLKSLPPGATPEAGSLASLEATCRRHRVSRRDRVAPDALPAGAARLHAEATSTLDLIAAASRRLLPAWLDVVQGALERWGVLVQLRDDDAGRQALAALGIDPPLAAARRASLGDGVEPLTLAEFTRWADDVLERVAYRPPIDAVAVADEDVGEGVTAVPDVVVTPLARTILRPFAAVVMPGADHRSLGAMPVDDSLLPRSAVEALWLPTAADRRDRELLAFAQVLRLPRVTLLRRRGAAGDPVAASPFVERLRSALADVRMPDGGPGDLRAWRDPRGRRRVAAEPVRPTAPTVPAAALPQRLSASAFEALRACPYRFFAERVLNLSEPDELDDEVEKRDYGTWLHDVLAVFHRERSVPRAAVADEARLRDIGDSVRAGMGIEAAAFLPYDASFAGFVPRYVKWLHDRERLGWRWLSGESETRRAPAELKGLELHGYIDRIDRREGPDGTTLELIDYKTGNLEKLKEKVREPLEDTQLAFYAALVGDDVPVTASYLAIDRTKGLMPVVHHHVADDARTLVAGIADEMRRLRDGAGLRALGQGSACDYCRARGLCRRDHWASDDDGA